MRTLIIFLFITLFSQAVWADFMECSNEAFDFGWTKVSFMGKSYCTGPNVCGGPDNYSKISDFEKCVKEKIQEQFPIMECQSAVDNKDWVKVFLSGKSYCLSQKVCGGPRRFSSFEGYSECITPKILNYSEKTIEVSQPTFRECSTSRKREGEIYSKCLLDKITPLSDRDHKKIDRYKKEIIEDACSYIACNPSIFERLKY